MNKILYTAIIIILMLINMQCITTEPKRDDLSDTSNETLKNLPENEPKQEIPSQTEKTKELIIGITTDNIKLNPLYIHLSIEMQLLTALYEGLFTLDPITLRPLAAMADHWEISEDKKTYRFFIRQDAYFSNGDPITANDFKASWLILIDPDNDADYAVYLEIIKGVKEYRNGKLTNPDELGIRIIADKILEVELIEPANHLFTLLSLLNFVPVHESLRELRDWGDGESIISNGPFTLQKWTDHEIIFLKNKLYWDRGNVKFDKILVKIYDSMADISTEYNLGNIHWAIDFDYESLEDKTKAIAAPLFSTHFYFFVCNQEPWNDYRVRKGLSLLLPWQEIRNLQFMIYPTEKLVPPIPEYPEIEGIDEQNIEEGLALLKEAGYPEGNGLPEITILISADNSSRIADIMSTTWQQELGVTVNIESVESRIYFDEISKHNYTISTYTWIGDFPDPLAFLQMWTSNSKLNEALFSDSEYDKFIFESFSLSGKSRYEKLAEAERILLQKAVILPMDHSASFNCIDLEEIGGWYINILDLHPFKFLEYGRPRLPSGIVRLFR